MLMLLLSIIFSTVSAAMMSYLAMSTQLGPWVAPVFVVACMVFVVPLVKGTWFYEHAVVTIASGSVGGMIGICLGLSFPSFYFLHKELFESWLYDPIKLVGIIFVFVIIAALYALFLGYFLRHYFLHAPRAKFPMSQLVYDVIFVDVAKKSHRLMMSGLGVATLWNSIMMMSRSAWILYAPQLHMFPLLMSVGFVAGMTITIPVFIGLSIREFGLKLISLHTGFVTSSNSFLMTFCFGMLLVVLLRMIIMAWKNRKSHEVQQRTTYWHSQLKDRNIFKWYAFIIGLILLWLYFFDTSVVTCVYTLLAIAWLSKYMVQIIAEVGIIEVDSYAWLVILPLVYMIAPSSIAVVSIAVFATLCLGLIVDYMFSYKLADLANISYRKVVRYQMIAVIGAAISSGLFFWWYCQFLTHESFAFIAPKAHELDHVIKFGQYDHTVLMIGMICACLVLLLTSELLIVIGALLMTPFMSSVLVIAGVCAYVVKKREKLYPLWFGIYAGHMLWLIVQGFL